MSRSKQLLQLRERVDSMLANEHRGAPDLIVALEAYQVFCLLAMLWPTIWNEFGRDLQRRLRNGSGVCCDCGETPIPPLLSHPVECRHCEEQCLAQMQEIGIDPHEPNKPEYEEILVDARNRADSLVNNLDEDFVDALEQMLEFRKRQYWRNSPLVVIRARRFTSCLCRIM